MATVNKDRKKYIDEKIASGSKLSRIELGKQWDEEQRYKKLSWEDKVKESFGEYAFWLTEDGGGFGPEMTKLLRDAVELEYSDEMFLAKYQSTKYYDANDSSRRAWDSLDSATKTRQIDDQERYLKGTFGSLFADSNQLRVVARETVRGGIKDVALANYVYIRALAAKNTDLLVSSPDAVALQKIASDYFVKLSSKQIEDVLIGNTNSVDLTNKLRVNAKQMNPHLAASIDAGLTMEDIAAPVRGYIARTLEMPENSINFQDEKYMKLLGKSENGDGQKSLGEVIRDVKTKEEYGWHFSNSANQTAGNLVGTMARLFGKVQ